jgi:hypothetical protein
VVERRVGTENFEQQLGTSQVCIKLLKRMSFPLLPTLIKILEELKVTVRVMCKLFFFIVDSMEFIEKG